MKMNYKKLVKLATLVITSLLIATVSADVVRYLTIDGSITVGSAMMIWILGDDAPVPGSSITGSIATVNLPVEQGTPINFTEVLFLKNDNATGSFNLNITVSTAVLSSDFNECSMHIYENSTVSWVYVDTIDLTNSADIYSGSLAAQDYLRMTFAINATETATGGKPFDVQVSYA